MQPLAVFVYGTLKRGQAREGCWPAAPLRREAATTRGRLYDLGAWPALLPGDDVVSGELRQFREEEMPAVLETLDRIEGFRGAADDLFTRVVIDCTGSDGRTVQAWCYLYARPQELADQAPITPGADGRCAWPAG